MKQKVFEPYVENEYLCGVLKRPCMKQLVKKLSTQVSDLEFKPFEHTL